MRILFIGNELSYRGTPKYLVNCARIAKSAGNEVLIWALDEGGAAEVDCTTEGIKVFVGLEHLRIILSFNPTIIHIHRAGGASHRDNDILRLFKQHCNCHILETNVFGLADLTYHSPIDLHAHISHWDLWRWRHWFWPFQRPAVYLPYCVDTEQFKPTASDFRLRYKIPDNAFLIGRLGKTDWSLVGPLIITTLQKQSEAFFASVDDYSGSALAKISIPEDIKSRIIHIPVLHGYQLLREFYSACDLTLNFSPIGESFGYGVAESMACGTPVMVHSKPRNDNAQIELAQQQFGCYPVANISAAIKTLSSLVKCPPSAENASKCRNSIVSRYSINTLAPIVLKVYELLSTATSTGRELQQQFAEAGFVTNISDKEIYGLLRLVIGGLPSLCERIELRLAHSLPNAIRIHRWWRSQHPTNHLPNNP